MEEALQQAQKIRRSRGRVLQYAKYRSDPFGFGRDILGEHYSDGQTEVMNSVVNNPVTIVRSSNGVGKTHVAARIAWWWFNVFEQSQVYTTAAPPFENLKKLLWGELMGIRDKNPGLFDSFQVRSMNIYRDSKSFITGVPIPMTGTDEVREAKFSGKHSPHLLFIVDEGDAVPNEVYKGIDSCMSGGDARMLIMFNPRAQTGVTHHKEVNRLGHVVELCAFDHPNVTTGRDVFPGAVTRNTVVRRIHDWTRQLTKGEDPEDPSCFVVPEFLIGYSATGLDGREYPPLQGGVRKVRENSFFYMVLGLYPPQGSQQLINQDDIDNARSRWDAYAVAHGRVPPFGVKPRLGVDVAEYGEDSCVACARYGGWVDELESWEGLNVDKTSMHVAKMAIDLDASLVLVDATALGAGVAPAAVRYARSEYNTRISAMPVKFSERPSPTFVVEIGEFKRIRDQMWWMTREWLATEDAMLPPDPLLLEELATPTYQVKQDGKIYIMMKDDMRKILKRSPDRAEALVMTHAPYERAKVISMG